MKTEKLEKGMVFKNYKELCSVLEMKVVAGNQKKLQLEELKRFCNYHKDGFKIIIDELFEEVKLKVDRRSNGNNIKYADDLEYLILSLLSQFDLKSKENIGFSKNFLYSQCGLINDNYKLVKGRALEFSQLIDMPVQTISECFDYTNNRILQTLQRTLNKMKKKSLITWGHGYNMVLLDEKKKQYLEVASFEAEKIILSIERNLMNDMKCNNKRLIFISGLWDSFKKKATAQLKEIYPNLDYYYDTITFNYNNDDIKNALKEYESIDKNELKDLVNSKFSKSLDGTIDRRHKKAKETSKQEITNAFDNYKKSIHYTKEQKHIKNVIIDKNSKSISLSGGYNEDKVKSLQRDFFEKYSPIECQQIEFFNDTSDLELPDVPF